MTDKELTKRLKSKFGKCPACGSSDLGASDYDGGRTMECRIDCNSCEASWVELYRFSEAIGFEPGTTGEVN